MTLEYYIYPYVLNGKHKCLIWYSNDSDGVLVEKGGLVLTMSNHSEALAYAHTKGYLLSAEDPEPLELDAVVTWVNKTSNNVDCKLFLDAWNLFDDVHSSVGGKKIPKRGEYSQAYEKLFWGCNLPAVTPEGQRFTPEWSRSEIALLRKALSTGLTAFRAATGETAPTRGKRANQSLQLRRVAARQTAEDPSSPNNM